MFLIIISGIYYVSCFTCHQVQEEDGELLLPMVVPMPMSEPIYDINGNAAEPGVGVEAGAGDGRGIHSDTSQDSSGRGTSLSSSETSSGAQSEVRTAEVRTVRTTDLGLTLRKRVLRHPWHT